MPSKETPRHPDLLSLVTAPLKGVLIALTTLWFYGLCTLLVTQRDLDKALAANVQLLQATPMPRYLLLVGLALVLAVLWVGTYLGWRWTGGGPSPG